MSGAHTHTRTCTDTRARRRCCCHVCTCCHRLVRLLEEIMSEKENKTIIFVETKRRCDELTRRMRRDGYVSLLPAGARRPGDVLPPPRARFKSRLLRYRWPAMGIHGDKSQQERDWVLNGEAGRPFRCPVGLPLLPPRAASVAPGQPWEPRGLACWQLTAGFSPPEFRYGKAPILIATDVASRGLGQYGFTGKRRVLKKVLLLSLTFTVHF